MTGPDYITFAAKLAATYAEAASCRSAKRIQNAFEACGSDLAALDQIKAGVADYALPDHLHPTRVLTFETARITAKSDRA